MPKKGYDPFLMITSTKKGSYPFFGRQRKRLPGLAVYEGGDHGWFRRAIRVRASVRADRTAGRLQRAERAAGAAVARTACERREADHGRFDGGADSAGRRRREVRQKADAEGLAQRRARRRLPLVRRRQRTAAASESAARAAVGRRIRRDDVRASDSRSARSAPGAGDVLHPRDGRDAPSRDGAGPPRAA